jgi:hypothetical protein
MATSVDDPQLSDLHMFVLVALASTEAVMRKRSPVGSICRWRLSRRSAMTWKPRCSLRSHAGAQKGVFTPRASHALIRRNCAAGRRIPARLNACSPGGGWGHDRSVRPGSLREFARRRTAWPGRGRLASTWRIDLAALAVPVHDRTGTYNVHCSIRLNAPGAKVDEQVAGYSASRGARGVSSAQLPPAQRPNSGKPDAGEREKVGP